jgi:hypothetical protein
MSSGTLSAVLFGLLVGLLQLALPASADASEISPAGQRLAAFLDRLDVEQRWPAGQHIDWETGLPDGKPEGHVGTHTHCSAFVASAAKQLGIYILRPPDHSQILLANAQYDWLAEAGPGSGWQSLPGGIEAQAHANRGEFVVAVYKNHHDDSPGHIAVIRPSDKTRDSIEAEGPQVIQAGGTNYQSTSLRQGFAGHKAAWTKNEVRYYAHAVP